MDRTHDQLPGDPSPETIRARAAEIRANWTESVERQRQAFTRCRLGIPAYTTRTDGTSRRQRFVPSHGN